MFLGDLRAERDSVSTTLTPRKYTALLAYLALHPARRFSRDELAALFWPDSDAEASRAALRTALSSLRRDFGGDLFDAGATSDTIRLREGAATTDVAQFEAQVAQAATLRALLPRELAALETALTLYCGPLLPGLYMDWVVDYRERLEARHRQAQVRHEVLRRSVAEERDARETAQGTSSFAHKGEGPALRRLPLYTGPFVGRENEIERLTTLLCGDSASQSRFLTITGPGGIGKTRLAVAVANAVAANFSGAVCFVPLAALSVGEEIGAALADALQIEIGAGNDPLQAALLRLRELGPSLLVLDNLEQIVSHGAARMIKSLLGSLPQITLLLTSRCLIGAEGEREFALMPLSADFGRQLFLEYAQAASLRDANTRDEPTLRALCERLDGIPLAIELCASWARVLTEQQMLEHMDRRFRLLVSRRQDLPDRHRSLHATLEWGCPTDPPTLSFFAALSVFRGGWTLEAAQAVAGPNALEMTASLREQSLLLAEPIVSGDRAMRYRMLESVREFASEKLPPDDRLDAQRRHLAYFMVLARVQTPRLGGAGSAPVFTILDRETANFRAAIEFGLSDTPNSLMESLSLMNDLRWCWGMRGHYAPHNDWATRLYARRDELPEEQQASVLMQYAPYCESAGSESLVKQALDIFERLGNNDNQAHAWEYLANIYQAEGDYLRMESAFRQAFDLHQANGDERGASFVLALHAGSLFALGRVADARALWKTCRRMSVELGEVGSVAVLDRAEGVSLYDEGRSAEAIPLFINALSIFRVKGESWQVLDTLSHLDRSLTRLGRRQELLAYLEATRDIAHSQGDARQVAELLAREESIREESPTAIL